MENITFNIEKFDIKLETNFVGRNFLFFDEIDSTNTFLLNKENNIEAKGTVVFAEKQFKGKGRLGRVWESDSGLNLTFSILLKNINYNAKNLSILNLASALTLLNSISNLFHIKPELKWPNDVLINQKKVAGILIETTFQGNILDNVVIGIGINVNQTSFQGDFVFQPTSLKFELRQNIEREKLLAEILNNFEKILPKIKYKSNEIVNAWKQNCNYIGKKVFINQDENKRSGIFEDIDEEGNLILKVDDKIEKINFGDVYLY